MRHGGQCSIEGFLRNNALVHCLPDGGSFKTADARHTMLGVLSSFSVPLKEVKGVASVNVET